MKMWFKYMESRCYKYSNKTAQMLLFLMNLYRKKERKTKVFLSIVRYLMIVQITQHFFPMLSREYLIQMASDIQAYDLILLCTIGYFSFIFNYIKLS